MVAPLRIAVGQRFGRLTVLAEAPRKLIENNGPKRLRCFEMSCDCGNVKVVMLASLMLGRTNSCGCLQLERITKHGQHESPEYRAHHSMKERCLNPNNKAFKTYGGRGITICERWLSGDGGKSGFECFLADLGPKPSNKHSLDRHPNYDGNYEPRNCRWATDREQMWNLRSTIRVEYAGQTRSLYDICAEKGLKYSRIRWRLKHGWTVELAIETPFRGLLRGAACR